MLIVLKEILDYCNNSNVNHNLKKKKLSNYFLLHANQSNENEIHYLACYK